MEFDGILKAWGTIKVPYVATESAVGNAWEWLKTVVKQGKPSLPNFTIWVGLGKKIPLQKNHLHCPMNIPRMNKITRSWRWVKRGTTMFFLF